MTMASKPLIAYVSHLQLPANIVVIDDNARSSFRLREEESDKKESELAMYPNKKRRMLPLGILYKLLKGDAFDPVGYRTLSSLEEYVLLKRNLPSNQTRRSTEEAQKEKGLYRIGPRPRFLATERKKKPCWFKKTSERPFLERACRQGDNSKEHFTACTKPCHDAMLSFCVFVIKL